MEKFIADVMLGRLARYLRMAGNDVLYSNKADDETILKICKRRRQDNTHKRHSHAGEKRL